MAKGDSLGGFEQVTMLALARLPDDAYGVSIRREISEQTGRDVNIGAVYAMLDASKQKPRRIRNRRTGRRTRRATGSFTW